MNKFRVASRFDERYKLEKCPGEKMAFQDFMELFSNFKFCLGEVLGEIIVCIGRENNNVNTAKELLVKVSGLLESIPEILGCFSCGATFIPGGLRDSEWSGKKAQLEKQLDEVRDIDSDDGTGLKCTMLAKDGKVCGKVCKNKLGLMAHQRSHNEK